MPAWTWGLWSHRLALWEQRSLVVSRVVLLLWAFPCGDALTDQSRADSSLSAPWTLRIHYSANNRYRVAVALLVR